MRCRYLRKLRTSLRRCRAAVGSPVSWGSWGAQPLPLSLSNHPPMQEESGGEGGEGDFPNDPRGDSGSHLPSAGCESRTSAYVRDLGRVDRPGDITYQCQQRPELLLGGVAASGI